MFIDTHTHYTHRRFPERDEIIRSLHQDDVVSVLECAIDFDSNERIVNLVRKYPHVYGALGLHPNYINRVPAEKEFSAIIEMLDEKKIIAIGETGLDYSRDLVNKELQKYYFEKFIALSIKTQLPLIIHCKDAHLDLIEILHKYKTILSKKPGIIHCFSGTEEDIKILTEMGFYVGVGGLFTRESESELRKALQWVPLEYIVFETDAPFLTPVGLKGKNTSQNLEEIIERFAKIRGESSEIIEEQAYKNTIDLFSEMKNCISDENI